MFASAIHFLTHFCVLVFPALIMPMSRDLGLSLATVLDISFWMYLLYGLLVLAWGWISDHWGHKWDMSSGILLASLGFILAGLVRSLPLITVSFAMVGIGSSAYHPAGVALVSQGIEERGRALGINGVWGNIGIASVPFVVGLLNYLIGWRRAVMIIGAVGLVVGITALAAPFSVERGKDVKTVLKLESKTALKLFIVFCFGVVFAGFMYRSFTLILPAFLEHRLGNFGQTFQRFLAGRFSSIRDIPAFQTLMANLFATGVYLLGVFGQAVGGRVADRFSLKWAHFVFFCAGLPFVMAVGLLQGALLLPAVGFFAYLTPARWTILSSN